MILDFLAKKLDQLMADSQLSSIKLGQLTGVSSDTIKRIRRGDAINPTVETLKAIASHFGLTISELIGETQTFAKPDGSLDLQIKLIPVIHWESSMLWPKQNECAQVCLKAVLCNVSKSAFCLMIENNDFKIFNEGGAIFIDPEVKYEHHDYVLIYKSGQLKPTIKRIINDDGIIYLQSIIVGLDHLLPLDSNYLIIGVVVGYEKYFKLIL